MTWPWVLSVDLATEQDWTCISVLEEALYATEDESRKLNLPAGWVSPSRAGLTDWQLQQLISLAVHRVRPPDPPLQLKHLERFQDVRYPQIVQRVAALMQRPPLRRGAVKLVLDATGVGLAVCHLFQEAGLHPAGVVITGGETVSVDGPDFRVPKKDLISITSVVLERRLLKVAPGLREARTLFHELETFRRKKTPTGRDSFEASWRDGGAHDDSVLSVSLGLWYRFWWSRNLDASAREWEREGISPDAAPLTERQRRLHAAGHALPH